MEGSMTRIRVAILGCTGVVGQRFIDMLTGHSYFEVVSLCASERSSGHRYSDIATWKLTTSIPKYAQDMIVTTCHVEELLKMQVRAVFCALDASVAGLIETECAKHGIAVFSNARCHRYDPYVPILIPHCNPSHLQLVSAQSKQYRFAPGGFIVTNANCSSTGLVIACKPIQEKFGIEKIFVTTLQAVSGAGYPGVASLDIFDNVVPFISSEEHKMETEPLKILGEIRSDLDQDELPSEDMNGTSKHSKEGVDFAKIAISASCNRVAVIDGHTEIVSLKMKTEASLEEIRKCWEEYKSEAQHLNLPSAPEYPIHYHTAPNRPQPRLDRDLGNGMTVSIGRLRECPLLDIKFVLCVHNTVIGAAGGSIQNAELAFAKGLLE